MIEILRSNPFMALFLALFFGYLIGKFKVGKFELGGIAGTLIAAVIIGQIGVQVDAGVKSIFFALFIYSVGFNGGPQFFNSINRSTITQVLAAVVMTVTGLFTVLFFAKQFDLGTGLAAGLAAGGLTQSAIIGTAGNAIDMLGLDPNVASAWKVDIAVGYSVTYIFGSLGPILMATGILPMLYKWDLRQAASDLATKLGGGVQELGEGEYQPLTRVGSRVFKVAQNAKVVGHGRNFIEDLFESSVRVEAVFRDQDKLPMDDALNFQPGDLLMLSGLNTSLQNCAGPIGEEYEDENGLFELVEESRVIFVTNKKLNGLTLNQLHEESKGKHYGVFYTKLTRMGNTLPLLPGTVVNIGDEISFTGTKADLDKVEKLVGYKPPSLQTSEFMTFGLGMVLGYLIGLISFKIGGSSVVLGSGLGCLVSGLLFGFMRAKHPRFSGISSGGANFMQTFGLAVFVGVVGLNAGKDALASIQQHGVTLFYLGVGATIIPITITFFINYYVLKIKNPVIAMAVIAGSRSGNPAFSALLEKTQNATPVAAFTVTYAVANILLTLWGPIIVAAMQ